MLLVAPFLSPSVFHSHFPSPQNRKHRLLPCARPCSVVSGRPLVSIAPGRMRRRCSGRSCHRPSFPLPDPPSPPLPTSLSFLLPGSPSLPAASARLASAHKPSHGIHLTRGFAFRSLLEHAQGAAGLRGSSGTPSLCPSFTLVPSKERGR